MAVSRDDGKKSARKNVRKPTDEVRRMLERLQERAPRYGQRPPTIIWPPLPHPRPRWGKED